MTPRMLIKSVIAHIGPNQVTEGFYKVEGSTLTMMGDDGKGNWTPVLLDDEPVTETVTPENFVAVAKNLTKRIRKAFRGEMVEGFSRRIDYPQEGIA